MTPDQVHDAIRLTTNVIIGCKKEGRRKFGTSHKAADCNWPPGWLERLARLKAQIESYRAMLKPENCEPVQ